MAISVLKGNVKWVELATATATSGSTVSFTSIPEYSNYLVQGFDIDGSDVGPNVRFNNDSGSNYSWIRNSDEIGLVTTSIQVALLRLDGSFQLEILGANNPVKQIEIWSGSYVGSNKLAAVIKGIWSSTDTINRIDFVLATGTYSSGSFKLYGRN